MAPTDQSPAAALPIQGDGVRLAAFEAGQRAQPTVVFVHGYPDTHAVWDRVIARLADRYYCVSYDVRGAGGSQRPRATAAYRLAHLAADLGAVIDAASPHEPVHIVGHDWGSIQGWEAVTEPALARRIAGFTSISGPCLDHVGHWLRGQWRADRRRLAAQARKSWYVAALALPGLAELAWHTALGSAWPRLAARLEGQRLPVSATLRRDGATGAKLYRANVVARLRRPRTRVTRVPVQVIHPERDPFVGPELSQSAQRWVDTYEINPIDAGHWAVVTQADTIAGLCRNFIDRYPPRPAARIRTSTAAPASDAARARPTP